MSDKSIYGTYEDTEINEYSVKAPCVTCGKLVEIPSEFRGEQAYKHKDCPRVRRP